MTDDDARAATGIPWPRPGPSASGARAAGDGRVEGRPSRDGLSEDGPSEAGPGEDGTGDAAVDGALARLAGLEGTPVREHVAVFEAVHAALQDRLADVED